MENSRTLEVLRSLPDETKKAIITKIMTGGAIRNDVNLTEEDLAEGLNKFEGRLDDLLVALLKTPFTVDHDSQCGVRLRVLIEHLGEDVVINDEAFNLLLTQPTKYDQATLLALALLSNKNKLIGAAKRMGANDR